MSANGEGEAVELVIGEGEEVQGEDGGGANADEEANKVHRRGPYVRFLEDRIKTDSIPIQKSEQEKGF